MPSDPLPLCEPVLPLDPDSVLALLGVVLGLVVLLVEEDEDDDEEEEPLDGGGGSAFGLPAATETSPAETSPADRNPARI